MRTGTVAFLLGIILLMQFPALPDVRWCLLLLPSVVLLVLFPRFSFLAAFVCGFLWALWHADRILSTTLPSSLQGRDVIVTGVIAGLPDISPQRTRFDMYIESVRLGGQVFAYQGRARISWYRAGDVVLRAGAPWRLRVRMKRPSGFANPGGFDYEKWLFSQHISATGYVRPWHGNQRLGRPKTAYWLLTLRQSLAQHIHQTLAGNPYGGIITALAIGDRQYISASQWQVMARTGITHLVAISGLHIGLVAGFVFILGRRLWRYGGPLRLRWPAPKVAAVTSVCAALFYAALAGFSLPAQRALIMVIVMLVGVLTDRRPFPSLSLALALLAVLVYDPLAVLSPGFWLSFIAVAAILLTMTGRLGADSHWRRYISLHVIVFVGLSPVLLAVFGQLPLVSPVANVVAVPWVSLFVVPLTLSGLLCQPFLPAAGDVLLHTAAHAMGLLWYLLEPLAGVQGSQWQLAELPLFLWPFLLFAVLLLLLPRGLPGRWLGLVLLLPIVTYRPPRPAEGDVWLTLLDVGQGLATVIETADHVMIYDTGPRFSAQFDAGHAVLLPFLHQRGIKAVDMLVIGHGDNDHIGGMQAVLEEEPVRQILSSVPARIGRSAVQCRLGQAWQWDGVLFEVLHPDTATIQSGSRTSENNASCVVRISSGNRHILLTGDIEKQAERRLLQNQTSQLPADILVVPHHGSLTSSSPPFVQHVSPGLALVPAGYLNRYGFPKRAVLARYDEAGSRILETGYDGAITVRLQSGRPLRVTAYRSQHRHFWQRR